jgi:hypothetical protein
LWSFNEKHDFSPINWAMIFAKLMALI